MNIEQLKLDFGGILPRLNAGNAVITLADALPEIDAHALLTEAEVQEKDADADIAEEAEYTSKEPPSPDQYVIGAIVEPLSAALPSGCPFPGECREGCCFKNKKDGRCNIQTCVIEDSKAPEPRPDLYSYKSKKREVVQLPTRDDWVRDERESIAERDFNSIITCHSLDEAPAIRTAE